MSQVSEFVAAAVKADPSLTREGKDNDAITKLEGETDSLAKDFPALDKKLTPLTYLYGNSPSTADVSLYCHLHTPMTNTPTSDFVNFPSVLRYFLQIQSLPPVKSAHSSLPNSYPPLDIDLSSLPAPERQVIVPPKKDKKAKKDQAAEGGIVESATAAAAAAGASVAATVGAAATAVKDAVVGSSDGKEVKGGKEGKKKEKKEKPAKQQPVKEEPLPPMPSMIDLRVGKVLEVHKHPDAETLYVEQIDVGEPEPRTVCSGLVKYMKEEDIAGATIIVVCNLKPVSMRGVKSYAMLLCASSKDGKDDGGIEFVLPPEGSKPGERIYFEGEKYENAQPEALLNPKKKVFETIQPGFTTLENRDAAWIDPETKSVHRIRTKDGICRPKTLVGASLS